MDFLFAMIEIFGGFSFGCPQGQSSGTPGAGYGPVSTGYGPVNTGYGPVNTGYGPVS
jgi:hypothetical protein